VVKSIALVQVLMKKKFNPSEWIKKEVKKSQTASANVSETAPVLVISSISTSAEPAVEISRSVFFDVGVLQAGRAKSKA
jgi:hypothetical protein